MKKAIILAGFLACGVFFNVNAQTVNGIKLSEIKSPYIQIETYKAIFGSKIYIMLEYGQKITDVSDALIKGEDGKNLEYNSLIDCLNRFKADYGYSLHQTIVIPDTKSVTGRTRLVLKQD